MDRDKDRQPSAAKREEVEDFGALFENSLKAIKPGEVVRGHVVQVTRDYVTVDIGYKSEGQIPIQEFLGRDGEVEVAEGDEVDVYFDSSEGEGGGIALSRSRAEQLKVWTDIERAYQANSTVEGTIVGKVKGGLKVDIGVSAFLPGSHADIRPARNLDRYIGQRGRFAILKFNRSRGNVVVSRRAVMEREREVLKEETLKVLEEGVILEGQVKNITDYGAFIDLGGIDGLLHITDMSWGRVAHRSEVLQVGDQLRVVIINSGAIACIARHEAEPARSLERRSGAVPDLHAYPRQSREPHGLRGFHRAREGRRGSRARLGDVLDQAGEPSS